MKILYGGWKGLTASVHTMYTNITFSVSEGENEMNLLEVIEA